jgi:hypothetical protein
VGEREHEQDRAGDRRQPADDAADPNPEPAGDEGADDDECRREQELEREKRQDVTRPRTLPPGAPASGARPRGVDPLLHFRHAGTLVAAARRR